MSNILLVEDSATQAMQMKLLLESADHTVTCVDDGTVALERLADGFNELVVTDLELPMLSGLDLIKKMQADFPQIPAVLVTAQGSERLAAEALKHGAAAYVPKAMLTEMLLGTVEDVLGVLRTDRSYAELIDHLTENRLIFDLPSKPEFIEPVIDLTMHMAAGMELLSGTDRHRVSTALRHVLSNSLYRGNLELTHAQWQEQCENEEANALVQQRLEQSPYKKRKVHFDARLMRDMLRVTVRDEGHGFDTSKFSHLNPAHAMDANKGRGLVLIHSFMDKVTYNEKGNEVTLIKHRSTRA
ncbi:MAG: response regulator [Pirellulaceae bacterium]|nr:response regulator [Pirellulaceae bacterium]